VEALRALTLATGDPQLRRAAFRLLVRLGKAEAAAQVAPDLASTPSDAQSHLEQGDALAKAGRFEEAAGEYRAALAIEPANAKAHSNLGAALASLGRFDAAIDEFNAALKLNPDLADVRRNLDLAKELRRKK
jgi:Flp pilus assembly protein TadD